jgi:hypothetical protein
MLFLSYAEEDSESARGIAEWFRRERQIEVYRWEDPEQRGGRFIAEIERAMNRADGFLALMSPDFVAAPYCHREAALAIQLEEDLLTIDPEAKFIRVLKVRDTPYREAGFLRSYDWLSVISQADRERALTGIADALARHEFAGSGGTPPDLAPPSFRNREDEVDRVLHGLTNAAGPHFWLVIAPPQLGKTWFMDHLAAKVREESVVWQARRTDVRDYTETARNDVTLLLMDLFRLSYEEVNVPDVSRLIARTILERRKPHLCLLDSAELLTDSTASELRSKLSEIYSYVERAGLKNVRLAFVVASRRDDKWRGVTPAPRLTQLPLTQFKIDVVRHALDDLARQMSRNFGYEEQNRNATVVYHMSEGLPALLVLCLRWIQKEQGFDIERLENQDLFESLATDYIRQQLLSRDSLLPSDTDRDDEPRRTLESAFRVLAPYRLFTQSHLRFNLMSDRKFGRMVEDLDWPVERLWAAISGTALMSRPLNEPWQATQEAIRRLLFRYFYETDARRIEAHRQARSFAEIWWDGQTGREQAIGLVECLWHEAAALRLEPNADLEGELIRSARTLAESIKPSSLYTVTELREAAANQMRNDEEFQETVGGLFTRLAHVVESEDRWQ